MNIHAVDTQAAAAVDPFGVAITAELVAVITTAGQNRLPPVRRPRRTGPHFRRGRVCASRDVDRSAGAERTGKNRGTAATEPLTKLTCLVATLIKSCNTFGEG